MKRRNHNHFLFPPSRPDSGKREGCDRFEGFTRSWQKSSGFVRRKTWAGKTAFWGPSPGDGSTRLEGADGKVGPMHPDHPVFNRRLLKPIADGLSTVLTYPEEFGLPSPDGCPRRIVKYPFTAKARRSQREVFLENGEDLISLQRTLLSIGTLIDKRFFCVLRASVVNL
jgi:hypothetical protein